MHYIFAGLLAYSPTVMNHKFEGVNLCACPTSQLSNHKTAFEIFDSHLQVSQKLILTPKSEILMG